MRTETGFDQVLTRFQAKSDKAIIYELNLNNVDLFLLKDKKKKTNEQRNELEQ